MEIFVDAEFLEDGSTIELISIAMVRMDGKQLYRINSDMDFARIQKHPWLMQHVMPSLPVRTGRSFPWNVNHPDFKYVMTKEEIRDDVRRFVLGTDRPRLWGWYSAYDHVVQAQLFGRMIDLPTGYPMLTLDLKQEHIRLGEPRLPEQESGEHNALDDALHNKVIFEELKRVSQRTRTDLPR